MQQVARTSQKQSSENCRQVELQNHDNWKTVATESNESTCVQLHASDIKLVTIKTVDIKSKTVKWTSKELQVSNCFNWPPMTAPAKQWKLWQLFPTRLMQAKLDNQTCKSWTASVWKTLDSFCNENVYIKQQNCKQMQKQLMHSSSTDLQTSAIPLFELQKLISAQTLESETKLHPKPSEARGYTYSLSWALQVCTFHHLSSAIALALTYATVNWSLLGSWWHEVIWKSTMKISLMRDTSQSELFQVWLRPWGMAC